MSAIGFPMRWSYLIANQVENRAMNRLCGLDVNPGLVIATYPLPGGDWANVQIWQGMPSEPKLPTAVQILQVDRLIDETLAKLRAIIAKEPLPDFSIPQPKIENPYSPEVDFFRKWAKDEQGRQVYVGLTFEESQELEALCDSDEPDDDDRYVELHDKHTMARLARIAKERSSDTS